MTSAGEGTIAESPGTIVFPKEGSAQMTENPPQDQGPLEEFVEPLEAEEEPLAQEKPSPSAQAEEEVPWKYCFFCGHRIPAPAKACERCGHALGPFEPNTPKEYFRFFFCGLLIVLGGFMPVGPDGSLMTLQTMTGGLFFIMGLGIMWNMWKAVYSGRLKMFWVWMLFIPIIWGFWRFFLPMMGTGLDFYDKLTPAQLGQLSSAQLADYHHLKLLASHGAPTTFGELFGALGHAPPEWGKVRAWFWVNGYGPAFIFAGSLLGYIFLVLGVIGGIRHNKQKAAQRAASGGRSRRR